MAVGTIAHADNTTRSVARSLEMLDSISRVKADSAAAAVVKQVAAEVQMMLCKDIGT